MRATAVEADTVQVLVPIGKAATPVAATSTLQLAPRLGDLRGRVIGLLDNHKSNSDKLLSRLQELLAERYGGVRFFTLQKPEAGRPTPPKAIEALAEQCHAVINGVGD